MPYTPNTWADNDLTKPLSAARMNKIEQGIVDAFTALTGTVASSGLTEQVQDIVGAFLQGGTYNDAANTYVLPSGGVNGSAPLDASAYGFSTGATAAVNGAALLACVQAAGKRPVTAPAGRYLCNVAFTDEDINLDMPGVTLVQPQGANPALLVERTFGNPVACQPTRVVEFGPRTPGGISSAAKYTAIDLSSGNYSAWRAGDLAHISSKDIYPWTWTGMNLAPYVVNPITNTYDGFYYQAGFVPLLGIGLLVTSLTNGGPQEQMLVQGSTSGAQGLVMSDLLGNAAGGITATQKHVLFAAVTGDFVAGETLTRIAGGNPQTATGETIATVGQAVGTVSGSPFLVANRLLEDSYGVVTAANIAAGGAYGPGTRYPVQTDNTVRLRKVDRTKICNVRAQFDIDTAAGTQDNYVIADNRTDMVKFRGVFAPQFDGRIFNAWTRAVIVTSCYMGRWRGVFDGLPNHAFLDQSAFGYGFECKSASEGNVFEFLGRNLRHAFTTNPNPRTFSTSNNNAMLDFGTPKHNTVRNSVVLSSYTNSYDTHPGDYYTRFENCVAIGGGSGGRYNSDGGAQFASRGFGTQFVNCRSVNSVEGVNYLGGEHDPGFDHTVLVRGQEVINFQSRGLFATDSITNRVSLVIDGGRYIGDGSTTNQQYQHETFAIGKGIKVTFKGEVEAGGFNGYFIRMREAGSAGIQSELDIISALVDYRGSTTANAQCIRVDGTLSRAVIGASALILRLDSANTPAGVISNRGGNTAYKIGHIVSERAVNLFATASAAGSPTSANLIDLGSSGGSAAATHNVSVAPTATAQTGAGTGPTVVFASGSTDVSGEVRVTTGTTPAAGAFVSITYGTAFGADVFPVIAPGLNAHTRAIGITTHFATGFTVQFGNSPVAATEYRITYSVSGV